MARTKTEQEDFWANKYAEDYIRNNQAFDHELGAQAWRTMLSKSRSASGSHASDVRLLPTLRTDGRVH